MIGKFLLGTALGGFVGLGALGLAVKISQLPEDVVAKEGMQIAEPAPKAEPAPLIKPAAEAEAAPETIAQADALPEAAPQPQAQPAEPSARAEEAAAAPDHAPQIASRGPAPLATSGLQAPLAHVIPPAEELRARTSLAPAALAEPAAPEAPPAFATSEALLTELPPLTPEEEALLAEMAAAALAAQGGSLAAKPETGAESPLATAPETIPPAALPAASPSALPQASLEATPTAAPLSAAQPIKGAKPDLQLSPLVEFAQPFENVKEKPLFSVVLIDSGEEGLDRQSFADLPLSVSFALDPSHPKAAEHAALYRAAGREVIMLLPAEAGLADLQTYAQVLPQSIVVMESNRRQFQSDRSKSEAFVPAIAQQGRGLLTWESQTNLADQLAKREGLPSALIFRPLDSDDEAAPVIRRYLDRAAFKADHDGTVVVLGRTRPETLKALIEWSIEGRSANVSLAPLSAVLTSDIKAKP